MNHLAAPHKTTSTIISTQSTPLIITLHLQPHIVFIQAKPGHHTHPQALSHPASTHKTTSLFTPQINTSSTSTTVVGHLSLVSPLPRRMANFSTSTCAPGTTSTTSSSASHLLRTGIEIVSSMHCGSWIHRGYCHQGPSSLHLQLRANSPHLPLRVHPHWTDMPVTCSLRTSLDTL